MTRLFMRSWRKPPKRPYYAVIRWKATQVRWLREQTCSPCDVPNVTVGGHKGPSLVADPVRQAAPGALFWVLSNGVVRKGMPVWSKLPEPQRWQLVSYLKSLEPSENGAR